VRAFPFVAAALMAVSLVGPAFAQEAPDGPVLQAVNSTTAACDPNQSGFRYVEVRGSGFDAWSGQRLVGTLVDANGAAQAHWPSVFVTPTGQVTLELNLCAQPIQNRPALDPGDYTLSVGSSDGSTIASAGISLQDPNAVGQTDTSGAPPPSRPMPRSGPGAADQPLAPGHAANLVDGWQLGVASINPDAFSAIKAAIPSAVAPSPDLRDLLIGLQATYVGNGTGTFANSRLALVNPKTGARYDQLNNNCGFIPGAVSPNVVTPGTVVLGNVCFSVPAGDIGSLVLVDNQSSPADRIYFALQ
jgi:hypothetical protein